MLHYRPSPRLKDFLALVEGAEDNDAALARVEGRAFAFGNGILAICNQGDPVSRTACGLYVRGMNHMLNTLQVHGQVRQIECSPGASTSNQKRDVFIAYLKANPQSRHLGSPLLFMRAMAEAFPCPPSQVLPPTDRKL